MALETVTPIDADIPTEWLNSSVMRHVANPLSDEALAEPYKSWIDAGPVDLTTWGAPQNGIIKKRHQAPDIPRVAHPMIFEAHQLFIDASRKILSEEMFARSQVYFGFRIGDVQKGTMQIASRPHIDAAVEEVTGPDDEQLRLVGFACDSLPTVLWQGALKPDSLKDGGLVSMWNFANRFKREPIPLSRLVIASPALLHEGGRAIEATPNRKFMRWHLIA